MNSDPLEDTRTHQIRMLNDQLRKNPLGSALGQIAITQSVMSFLQSEPSLVPKDWLARRLFLLRTLADFDDFGHGNNPHKENDFAFFTAWDREFYFKIDYYDTTYAHASPDPADLKVTRRLLTIGFPEDY